MLERIIILGIILLTLFVVRKKMLSRSNEKILLPGNLKVSNISLPTIIYFWTEQCSQCSKIQKPVLHRLKSELLNFNFISVDALREKEITSTFNIKTVPSTIIFSPSGEALFINNGLRGEEELKNQIELARL